MTKKKVSLIIAAGVLATALVGGSLAWFTDKDTATNHFKTGSIAHEIVEVFNPEGPAQDLLPGDEVNKDVWIDNTATSDALLRVKITATLDGKDIAYNTNPKVLELVFAEGVQEVLGEKIEDGTNWVKGNDGYFYYTKIFAKKGEAATRSEQLLDAVRIDKDVEDQKSYGNKKIDVIINSETVQVNSDAYRESWEITGTNPEEKIISMLDGLVKTYKDNNNKIHVEEKVSE